MEQQNPSVGENSMNDQGSVLNNQTKEQKGNMGLVIGIIAIVAIVTAAFLMLQKTNILSQKSTTSKKPEITQNKVQESPAVLANEDLSKDITELDGEDLNVMDQQLNQNDQDIITF